MKRITITACLMAATLGLNAQKPMNAPKGGKAISDELIGIFFEDISSSADGGLYAELIQNGSFEYSPAERDGWGAGTAWKQIRPGHSLGTLEVRKDNTIHPNNPTYLRLYAERVKEYYDYTGWKGFGIENEGFKGISARDSKASPSRLVPSTTSPLSSATRVLPSRFASFLAFRRDGARIPNYWQKLPLPPTARTGRNTRLC